MYINKVHLSNYQIQFPIEHYGPLNQILFLDIETTGLSPASSQLYMIGLSYYDKGTWTIEQWMAERVSEERELLTKLCELLPKFTHIMHFNGNRFDIPYLTAKAKEYFMDLSFDSHTGIDIYKRIVPIKNLLVLPDCRQKTIEQFLGFNRIDKFSGGELIHIYKNYLLSPTESALNLLIQHNLDDMKGMLDILPILTYTELCDSELTVVRAELLKTKNIEQKDCYELVMHLRLPFHIPKKIFTHFDGNMITAEHNSATLKVPVFDGELKFFYSNYKEYYYIPSIDAAFHKSVVAHLDTSLREKATAANCYTRQDSLYLKQYRILIEPFFKKDYKDKYTYFEITDEIKSDRQLFSVYCSHIIRTIIQGKDNELN